MRWTAGDIDTYLQSKDYVDTCIIPTVPVTWDGKIKSSVSEGEFAVILVDELERQLKGRVMHFPPFTYLKSEEMTPHLSRMKKWKEEILQSDMKYVFFITSDVEWKNVESEMGDSLIWLPAIPFEHMDAKNRREVIDGQIKQLLEIITIKWRNGYNNE